MARIEQAITIKQYDNRRLCNAATASYVTVDDRGAMVAGDKDITRIVLKRIIIERAPHG